jgi:hypothetical protein
LQASDLQSDRGKANHRENRVISKNLSREKTVKKIRPLHEKPQEIEALKNMIFA